MTLCETSNVESSTVPEKKAYTPAEFAALFGREKTWTYRLLYAGKIKGIKDYGRMMIPASEADRIEGAAAPYQGKGNKKSAADAENSQGLAPPPTESGNTRWSEWVKNRKDRGSKKKGMTRKS
ncbi:MAG: DNA-binding protein [Verrucomicrobiaceae bacterium]|nr:MAG: DNA-binding protein [Verrucomicrobiaceae bacterium]